MEQTISIIDKIKEKSRSKTKSVLILLLICILLALMSVVSTLWFGRQSNNLIKVSGNNVLTTSEIFSIVDQHIKNTNNDKLDLAAIKQTLQKSDIIAGANVYVNSRGVLGIEIEERVPIAIVLDNAGVPLLVDQFSEVFNLRLYNSSNDFPIISNAYTNNNKINKIALQGAITIIQDIQDCHPQLYSILSEIRYNNKHKTYSIYLTEFGININIGKADNLSNKLSNILLFWQKVILPANNKSKFTNLDARWENSIIVNN